MNATVRFLVWGTMPVGGIIGGVLGTALGLRGTLWVAGIGGTVAFVWLLPSPGPRLQTIPDQLPDPATP
jgi:predicted MFS family arabinose efflux permease